MKTLFYSALIVLVFTTCRKDVGKLPASLPAIEIPETFTCEDTSLNWQKFPSGPSWDYDYHLERHKLSVFRVMYDPTDRNVIYYTTIEDGNFYQLWRYDRSHGIKTLLDKNILIDINIHQNGWLIYEKKDKNIYKIKGNGDSLTKLSTRSIYRYPIFSEDGQKIFVWDSSTPKGYAYIMDLNGKILDTLTGIYGPVYPIKNMVYYGKVVTNSPFVISLVSKDLETEEERTIVTRGGPGDNSGENMMGFFPSENNTVLYWHGHHGLSKTDLNTLQTTRIINAGNGSQNPTWNFRQSPISGRFIAIQYNQELVDPYTIRCYNNILEFTEDGTCRRKVEIPD